MRVNILLLICTYCVLFSCRKNVVESDAGYQYQIPPVTDDGWETASLASVGMDESYMIDFMNKLRITGLHRIHSLLIVKDGKLVFEVYFSGDKFNLAQYMGERGFDRDDTHNLCSATKSFTSALVGIAIDQGLIRSVDEKVFDFFPEYAYLLVNNDEKRDLTIKHLLTMTSGLEWDDETLPYSDPQNDMNRMFNSSDPIQFVLAKDLFATPGTVFDYDNGNTNVLGEIVHKASGQRLDVFSETYLFSKLGITDFEWQRLPNNVTFASGDLRLRPRDMAKFGHLFLKGGMWNGERVISRAWIDVSTHKYLDPNDYNNEFGWAHGYGYQWWQWDHIHSVEVQAYFASGWGGQWIIGIPQMDLVVVQTAGNYYSDEKMPIQSILVDYILPSLN